MEIKEGYVYHIKNDYFELVNDDKLMKNHEGKCDTIVIGNYRGKDHAFLLQNMLAMPFAVRTLLYIKRIA